MVEIEQDTEKLIRTSEMLKAIAHPTRMGMMKLLENTELSVSELQAKLGIEQAVVSQHLKIMKDKQVLECRREGKNSIYFLKFPHLSQIVSCVERCQQC